MQLKYQTRAERGPALRALVFLGLRLEDWRGLAARDRNAPNVLKLPFQAKLAATA
jgi:hypothetical protein